jgi:uncharacterized membrane protein YdjX (TVP38/TMEM64 family)
MARFCIVSTSRPSLRRRALGALAAVPRVYVVAGLVAAALVVVGFVVASLLDPRLLSDPSPWLDDGGPGAAVIGLTLLLVDVAVPTPSSVVMAAHGSLFGVVGGALLSLAGSTGATLLAFAVGRRSRSLVERRVDPVQRERVRRFLDRNGVLALVVTRPVPVVAETVALLAGTTPMTWRAAALGGLLGNVVPAVVYAVAGAYARSLPEQGLVLLLVLALSLVLWIVVRRRAGVG